MNPNHRNVLIILAAIIGVPAAVLWIDSGRSFDDTFGQDVVALLVASAAVVGLIAVIQAGVKRGVQQANAEPPIPSPADGPGKFKVDGVDRDTRKDTTMYIDAASAANAKAKAELEGIVVTSVTKV